MEKFSVLMSVYAREKGAYLEQALASVFEQTVAPNEVVLVEDGSLTEELYAVIDRFEKTHNVLKVVKLPQNVGLGEALNQGLQNCSYDLVARMDSDDVCKPHRFEEQLKAFEAHPHISVVGSWIDEFCFDPSVIESTRKLPETPEDIAVFARSKCPLNHPSVMFKKSVVLSVGGYMPFYLFEDYYLWARLLKGGYKLYNLPKSLVLMRTGNGMLARRGGWKYAKSEVRLQREFLKMGFVSCCSFIQNVSVRFVVRMMPNKLRTFVYQKFLRS